MANWLPSTKRWRFLIVCCVMCFGMLLYFGGTYNGQNASDLSRLALRRLMEWLPPDLPLVRNLFGAGSQPKLCYMSDADEKPVKEDHEISEPATNLLPSIMLYLLILCVLCFGLLTYFGGNYWEKVRDSLCYIQRVLPRIPFVGSLFGGKYKQKLLYVPDASPDADNEQKVGHAISEPALFRFLLDEENSKRQIDDEAEAGIPKMLNVLKDIDKNWEIKEFETHQSSMHSATDSSKAFHVFIVFKTTSEKDGVYYWWSLEKNRDYIVLQRSRNKENVKDKLKGKQRYKVKPITDVLKGKGTIQDLFAILWAQQLIAEKYHIKKSNCQSLVTFVGQQITEIRYKYKGFFKYSPPPEKGLDKKMLDLINVITGCSDDWSPLFHLITMGSTDLVDKIVAGGQYDINASCNGLTPLHLAIKSEKTKMVKHLLEHPLNADPTKRDASGRNALQFAATITMKVEIMDLLLAHGKVKVDDVDENGQTALHLAARETNVIAVQKLIEKGADPNIFDKEGQCPLHVAAQERDGIPIIDLLLEAQKVKGIGDVNDRNEKGRTALHYAAAYSNEITAKHLIEKRADVNCRANVDDTPLHYAALGARDMKIIDVLLQNINEGDIEQYKNDGRLFFFVRHNLYGLEKEIADRLLQKSIKPPCTENDDCTGESDEATGVNIRRFVLDKGADPSIDLTGFDGLDFLIARVKISLGIYGDINRRDKYGETLLLGAIRANYVNGVRRLLEERGADPTIRNNKGDTPFHLAVDNHIDFDILNLLLGSGKVDINETTSEQGRTALHMAVTESNTAAAEFLLSKGANPNVADQHGETPLHLAAWYAKDMDIVELLLNHPDVDVNLVDDDGRNALHWAKNNQNGFGETIANLLKEKGAVEKERKFERRKLEFFKKLILDYSIRKPLENILSDKTKTAREKCSIFLLYISEPHLVSSIRNSNVKRLRFLLEIGVDISSARGTYAGMNALHVASYWAKTTDLIDVVLEAGKFDINGVDNDGRTPLYWAIMKSNVIAAHFLLSKGANPNVTTKNGRTPLHMAAENAEMHLIEILLNTGAVDVNCIDIKGRTPLTYARYNKNKRGQSIIARLKEYGAKE